MKILIVDDYHIDLYLAKETINELNIHCEIFEAEDGEKALQILNSNNIDIVLLDIKMPKMDGIEVLKQIRKNNKNINVIMLTTSDMDDDIKETYKEKANGYIIKPIKPQIFVNRLKTMKGVFVDKDFEYINFYNTSIL